MKLKAVVLTAGLIAFGVTNAAFGETYDTCKTNLDGQTRKSGSKCTSKSYKFNTDQNCTCPGDKPQATKKCVYNRDNWMRKYSCEVP